MADECNVIVGSAKCNPSSIHKYYIVLSIQCIVYLTISFDRIYGRTVLQIKV